MRILNSFFDKKFTMIFDYLRKIFQCKNNVCFYFLIVFVVSLLYVFYFQKYNISLPDDDLLWPYNVTYIQPVRNRFFGSALFHFFLSTLPNMLGTHVNDLKTTLIPVFISFSFCSVVFLFTYIPFMFSTSKNESTNYIFSNNKIIDISKISFSFIILYILCFLVFFNDSAPFYASHVFSADKGMGTFFFNFHFNILESVGYFEYILNAFPILLFIILLLKLMFNDSCLTRLQIFLLMFVNIYLAFSVELINIYLFSFLTSILFFSFLFFKNERKRFLIFLSSYCVFIISLLCYYSYYFNNSESSTFISNINFEYIKNNILFFFHSFFLDTVILSNIPVLLFSFLLFMIILFYKNSNKKILILSFFNICCIIFPFFIFSFLLVAFKDHFLLREQYLTVILFPLYVNFFLLLGYSISLISKKFNNFDLLIFSFVFLIFASYPTELLTQYHQRIKAAVYKSRERRYIMYQTERIILSQIGKKEIDIPMFELFDMYQPAIVYYIVNNYGNIFYNTDCFHYKDITKFENFYNTSINPQNIKFTELYQYKYPIIYPPNKDYVFDVNGDSFCYTTESS